MTTYVRALDTNPDAVVAPQRDFWATLYLVKPLDDGQRLWFTNDPEGEHILESMPVGGDPCGFAVRIPVVSDTEPTTIYLMSDGHIPDMVGMEGKPEDWPAAYHVPEETDEPGDDN